MNLQVHMYFYFSGNIFACFCPFFLANSNCVSLFVEWKLATDVENVLNKQNEVDAVSLTLGTFLATNCRSFPRKSQAKELYRDCLRKGILRLAEKNLVQTSACSTQSLFACFVLRHVGLSS